jgi:hypothetical protein
MNRRKWSWAKTAMKYEIYLKEEKIGRRVRMKMAKLYGNGYKCRQHMQLCLNGRKRHMNGCKWFWVKMAKKHELSSP